MRVEQGDKALEDERYVKPSQSNGCAAYRRGGCVSNDEAGAREAASRRHPRCQAQGELEARRPTLGTTGGEAIGSKGLVGTVSPRTPWSRPLPLRRCHDRVQAKSPRHGDIRHASRANPAITANDAMARLNEVRKEQQKPPLINDRRVETIFTDMHRKRTASESSSRSRSGASASAVLGQLCASGTSLSGMRRRTGRGDGGGQAATSKYQEYNDDTDDEQ